MPRYSKYRRTYFNKSYPRKRWASNIVTKNTAVSILANANDAVASEVLCINSSQTTNPTPVILKFGRVKFKGDVRTDLANNNNFVSALISCVFVPQGMSTNSILEDHPEYILGWTTVSLDSGNTFSFSTALKRNLNSGDRIVLLISLNSAVTSTNQRNFLFYYTVQYWTSTS